MIQEAPLIVLVDGFARRGAPGFEDVMPCIRHRSHTCLLGLYREWLAQVAEYVANRASSVHGAAMQLAATFRRAQILDPSSGEAVANWRSLVSEMRRVSQDGDERRHMETLMVAALAYRAETYEDIVDTIDVVGGSKVDIDMLYVGFRRKLRLELGLQ